VTIEEKGESSRYTNQKSSRKNKKEGGEKKERSNVERTCILPRGVEEMIL
jgi:hypothetical protein